MNFRFNKFKIKILMNEYVQITKRLINVLNVKMVKGRNKNMIVSYLEIHFIRLRSKTTVTIVGRYVLSEIIGNQYNARIVNNPCGFGTRD